MASLVDSIMQQLLSKDVLYQPMKVGDVSGSAIPPVHTLATDTLYLALLEAYPAGVVYYGSEYSASPL